MQQSPSQELAGKVAVVTGGASGIGRAAAQALARRGASLVVADVQPAGLGETVRLVCQAGGAAIAVHADVRRPDHVAGMVDAAVRGFGGLDLAVNSAGVGGLDARTAEYPEDDWQRTLDVNLTGVWHCLRHEIPAMLARGGGAIVNVASVAGLVGFPRHAAYAASKHGVVGLTRTAALEYARQGVRINAVCPGFTSTPMVERITGGDADAERALARLVPLGRLGTPEEIAEAICYLCAPASAFMVGHALVLDGGIVAA
jgi:NAD(P)-dependent dehydrogenase (short-subunit alcohol dehydrogenase family)